MKIFLRIIVLTSVLTSVLTWAVSSFAQSISMEIHAIGEQTLNGVTEDVAKQSAVLDATRKALRETADRLQNLAEIKALQLKPAQLDAFVAAIVVPETKSPASAAGAQVYRAEVVARLDSADTARRMAGLRKDQDATRALMEVWNQSQEVYRQLSALPSDSRSGPQRRVLLTNLQAKQMAGQVYAALAKTEEGTGSSRVTSPEGFARAKQLAAAALAAAPDSADAHYAMGDVLAEDEQAEAAAAEYRKALQGNPNSSSGHTRLANALRLEGNVPEAIAELREALRLDPGSAPAHTDLGILLAAQRNESEAISEYKEAIRLDPDLIDAHNNLAIALARQRRIPDSVAEFKEIVRIDPDSALGYYNMAIALADMEKDAESAEALREVVRINPNHFNAHFNIGELFRLETKYDEAVKQFKEYLRLAPDTPQNQRNIKRAKDFVQAHDNP